jgi:hypothetical protein
MLCCSGSKDTRGGICLVKHCDLAEEAKTTGIYAVLTYLFVYLRSIYISKSISALEQIQNSKHLKYYPPTTTLLSASSNLKY